MAMTRARSFLRDERGTETLGSDLVCGLLIVGTRVAVAMIGPKIIEHVERRQ